MGQERRRYERITYHAPCRYEVGSGKRISKLLESGTSFVKNISLGGLLIEMMKQIDIDSLIDLEVVIPTAKEPIRAQARVVWVNRVEENEDRYDVGMSFTSISLDDKDKISSIKKRIENVESAL